MKVLFVSRWFWEERRRHGGGPGFCGELAEAIAQKGGIDLTILSQAGDAGLKPELHAAGGLKVYLFSREKRRPAAWLMDKMIKSWAGYRIAATDAAVIRCFVREHGPFDAIVAQCEEPDGLACALAVRAGSWPPLVMQVHDLRYEFGAGKVRFVRKSSLGFVFRKSARIMANSKQTALWLEREYGVPARKIGQCRIHLTEPFLRQAELPATQSTEERILFLGALNRKKGPDIFLRAVVLLARERSEVTFALAGSETADDFSFRSTLRELAADPSLAGRVEFLGRLEPAAVIEQIQRARVVVCPSRVETFSRTTVEALALGRPVIVSETTGAAHWVKSTGAGAVVPPDDPALLAQAMREWLLRMDMPEARAQIRTELTASRAAEDWLREVERALTSPRSRA